MKLVCQHCGNEFEGKNDKFCSNGCRDSHIVSMKKRVREAIENDPNHTSS